MEAGDLQKAMKKIPSGHRKLLRGYKFHTQGGNTLAGDGEHIGSNDLNKKKIIIAAPWNYGREFALLHEIGHLVWANFVAPHKDKVRQWQKIAKTTKKKLRQNTEELFCHAYANTYAKNKITVHDHPEWEDFVKNL
jgi:hypothetical protein